MSCDNHTSCCSSKKNKKDYLFYISLVSVVILYILHVLFSNDIKNINWLTKMSETANEMVNATWWGIALGVVFAGILSKIPKEFVMLTLGKGGTLKGILRATGAGLLFDLCNHGILVIATKLYERGASTGQVIAFLVASPWNSLSLTLILVGLIGLKLTALFTILSMVIAIITGVIFEKLIAKNILPANQNTVTIPEDFNFKQEAKTKLKATEFNFTFFKSALITGIKDSKVVLKWVLIGTLIAGFLRAVLHPEQFQQFFGPSIVGLMLTVVFASVLEVCSEGSVPIASDIINNANSTGNGFAFLMAGVSTDYTEIMILKETTKSFKIPLFLPLITLPQIIAIAILLNMYAV